MMPSSEEDVADMQKPFFALSDSKARIFTDVKIDDCLALWYFICLNCRRRPCHSVHIEVCVIGIKDFESAVRLAKDVCGLAIEHARNEFDESRDLPSITYDVYGSKNAHDTGPRHEADTYAPYQGQTPDWSKESQQEVKYFDMEISSDGRAPDLIWVIGQFFNWEIRNHYAPSFEFVHEFDRKLRFLTLPRKGGCVSSMALMSG